MNRARRVVALALVVSAASCGSGKPQKPQASPTPNRAPALHDGPLTDYVAAAGLRWLAVGRPAELARNARLLEQLTTVFPSERLDAFARTSGIELRQTPEALAAGFDYGTLYMAATPGDNQLPLEAFRERALSGLSIRTPHPDLIVATAMIGTTPQTLVRIDRKLVAWSIGDPTPARVVEAFARRRLARSPTALRGSALSTLPAELDKAKVRFYAPGPFDAEWAPGALGLLGATVAVGAAIEAADGERIRLKIVLSGDWHEAGADERLLAAWGELAESAPGRLLALNDPLSAPRVTATADLLSLEIDLSLPRVMKGIKTAVSADVWEILEIRRREGANTTGADRDGGASRQPKP